MRYLLIAACSHTLEVKSSRRPGISSVPTWNEYPQQQNDPLAQGEDRVEVRMLASQVHILNQFPEPFPQWQALK